MRVGVRVRVEVRVRARVRARVRVGVRVRVLHARLESPVALRASSKELSCIGLQPGRIGLQLGLQRAAHQQRRPQTLGVVLLC